MLPLLLPFLLFACTSGGDQGTVVGNPGDSFARVAPPSGDVTITRAEIAIDAISVGFCDAGTEEFDVERTIDLLADADDFEVPGGLWCSLGLVLEVEDDEDSDDDEGDDGNEQEGEHEDATILLAGTAGSVTWEAALELDWLEVVAQDGGYIMDGQTVIFELAEPDWLSAELIGKGPAVTIDPDSALAATLADAIAFRSAIYEDVDGDTMVGEDERADGAVATGADRQEEPAADTGAPGDDDDDADSDAMSSRCGGSAQGWLLAPLFLLGLGRLSSTRRASTD